VLAFQRRCQIALLQHCRHDIEDGIHQLLLELQLTQHRGADHQMPERDIAVLTASGLADLPDISDDFVLENLAFNVGRIDGPFVAGTRGNAQIHENLAGQRLSAQRHRPRSHRLMAPAHKLRDTRRSRRA